MASAYFPRLYAVFPRPNAAFASSRRAAAVDVDVGAGAADARSPTVAASDASTTAIAHRSAHRIALTLHARPSLRNICLRCSFTPAYGFRAQRARIAVVSRRRTQGDGLMTSPRIAYIVAALATAGACNQRPQSSQATDSPDASVRFQSAIVTTPATWNSLYGSWPALRYDHGMVYDSDLKRIVVFGG